MFIVWLFLLPLIVVVSPTVAPVQAASACEGDIASTGWNTTVQRHALVPFDRPWQSMWMFEDEGRDKGEEDGPVMSGEETGEFDPALHPEESWMYTASGPLTTLRPLEEGHYITMEVGNDSVGALRLNRSSNHRTTFCVSLFSTENGEQVPAEGDIYLMTSSQYTRYEEAYWMMHGGGTTSMSQVVTAMCSAIFLQSGGVSTRWGGKPIEMSTSIKAAPRPPFRFLSTAQKCFPRSLETTNGRISTS